MKHFTLMAALLAVSLFLSACVAPPLIPLFSDPGADATPAADDAAGDAAGADSPELRALAANLAQAVLDRDYAALGALLGEGFRLALWRSEGSMLDPEETLGQLEEIWLGPAGEISFDTTTDVRQFLGEDFAGVWGPDVTVAETLYAIGLGAEGRAEAVLALGTEDNRLDGAGRLVWLGMVIAPEGFGPLNEEGAGLPTGLNILRTTPLYGAPSLEDGPVGLLRPGQTVDVLEASADGGFWRIPCPVSVAESCWVVNDPASVEPVGGAAPAAPTPVPTPTPVAPTPAPVAEESTPERIVFAATEVAVSRQGAIGPAQPIAYILRAEAGRAMTVNLVSPQGDANFSVTGAANGQPYKRIVDESRLWTFTVPVTQDYVITLQSGSDTTYALTIVIPPAPPQPPMTAAPTATATPLPTPVPTLAAQQPERIRFAVGEISALRSGTAGPELAKQYLLDVQSGQTVSIEIISGGDEASFGVNGVSDRQIYKRAEVAADDFTFVSPIRQDYLISVVTGVPTNYTLIVTVLPLETPLPEEPPAVEPQRLTIPGGETGLSFTRIVDSGGADGFLLRAVAGQVMSVRISSPESIANFSVTGYDDGAVLKSLADPARAWDGLLPATQDYLVVVANPRPVRVQYTLSISFSPLDAEPRPDPTATPRPAEGSERIVFAPGAVSATVGGALPAGGRSYVLRAGRGQTMTVELYAGGGATFSVAGRDGNVLKSSGIGGEFWSGTLPATQDYFISVLPVAAAVEFGLVVTVVN